MEIRDVVATLRGEILQLQLEVQSLRAGQTMLERFTWNLITDVRKAVESGQVEITWTLEDEDATDPGSTVDSPHRTDDWNGNEIR